MLMLPIQTRLIDTLLGPPEIVHLQPSQLLASYGQLGVVVADLEVTQRTALIVEITHYGRRPITAAA